MCMHWHVVMLQQSFFFAKFWHATLSPNQQPILINAQGTLWHFPLLIAQFHAEGIQNCQSGCNWKWYDRCSVDPFKEWTTGVQSTIHILEEVHKHKEGLLERRPNHFGMEGTGIPAKKKENLPLNLLIGHYKLNCHFAIEAWSLLYKRLIKAGAVYAEQLHQTPPTSKSLLSSFPIL